VSPFESLVVDALDRIERKCDGLSASLADHAETDRVQFLKMDSVVDTLLIDHHGRKQAASEAGRAAGSSSGKFWAGVGALLSALIAGLAAAAR